MEIRVLRNFLMVAREENITKAANLLHITETRFVEETKKIYGTKHREMMMGRGEVLSPNWMMKLHPLLCPLLHTNRRNEIFGCSFTAEVP